MTSAPDFSPSAERLEALVGFCERRVLRAHHRVQASEREHAEAVSALNDANRRRAEWAAAHPDPQQDLTV